MQTAPVGRAADVADVQALAREVAEVVLEPAEDALLPAAQAGRFARLWRGVKGLVSTVGAFVAAVSSGVIVSLLTAPEAAMTLLARLIGYFL